MALLRVWKSLNMLIEPSSTSPELVLQKSTILVQCNYSVFKRFPVESNMTKMLTLLLKLVVLRLFHNNY